MSYEKLINTYLDRYYYTKIITEPKDKKLCVSFADKNERLSDVENELFKIFGHDNEVSKILNIWYTKSVQDFTSRFNQFLNQCRLKLGLNSWITYHPIYGLIDEKNLSKYYTGGITPNIRSLNNLYDKWFEYEVIKTSEQYMKLF